MRVGIVWPDPVGDEGVDAALDEARVAVEAALTDAGYTVCRAEAAEKMWVYDIVVVLGFDAEAMAQAVNTALFMTSVVIDCTMLRVPDLFDFALAGRAEVRRAAEVYRHRYLVWLEAELKRLTAITEAKP
jgi:hypothetical protein